MYFNTALHVANGLSMSSLCQPSHSSLDPTVHFALRQEHSERVICFITLMVNSHYG